MIYGKIDRYLLIALVAIGLVCLYFLFTNHKKGNDRDNLLVAMARKLGATEPDDVDPEEKKQSQNSASEAAPTEEEEVQITNISDKLCFSKALTQEETEFQKRFPQEIQEELMISRQVLGILINKFMAGVKEFDNFEKEFYEANKEEIDTIIHNRKVMDSLITKLIEGKTDFTAEELQCQQNYPQYIEQALAQIRNAPGTVQPPAAFAAPVELPAGPGAYQPPIVDPPAPLTGANPPLAAGERLKMVLSFFDDKRPKTITELAQLYAGTTQTKLHTGNMSIIFGKLVEEGKLMCTKAGKDKKIYHGPPEWFEKKALKKEFKDNIKS